MFTFPQNLSYKARKTLVLSLAISSLMLLNACGGQEISDESTLGSNNAAQTNPDKIERNSMDDQTQIKKNLDDNTAIESTREVDP